jgi:hypothetical protein
VGDSIPADEQLNRCCLAANNQSSGFTEYHLFQNCNSACTLTTC